MGVIIHSCLDNGNGLGLGRGGLPPALRCGSLRKTAPTIRLGNKLGATSLARTPAGIDQGIEIVAAKALTPLNTREQAGSAIELGLLLLVLPDALEDLRAGERGENGASGAVDGLGQLVGNPGLVAIRLKNPKDLCNHRP